MEWRKELQQIRISDQMYGVVNVTTILRNIEK